VQAWFAGTLNFLRCGSGFAKLGGPRNLRLPSLGAGPNVQAVVRTKSRLIRRGGLLACLALVALMLAVPLARAADPSATQQGNGVSRSAQSGSDSGSGKGGLEGKVVGGLPFTGLDVLALFSVAIALTSMGIVLRRMSAAD
jgi:hypothetical protein